jgi:hypothetical protein
MYERPRAKAFRLLAEEGSCHTVGIRPFGALKYRDDPEIALNRAPRLKAPVTRFSYFCVQERIVGLGEGFGY